MTTPVLQKQSRSAGLTTRPPELELTILMPCLNEAETISVCVTKARGFLERSGVKARCWSPTTAPPTAPRPWPRRPAAAWSACSTAATARPLIGGIEAARGRFIIMGDGDDSYDFERLDGMLERLRDGAQLVMGNRFRGGIEKGAMPFLHRYLGQPGAVVPGRLFFRVPIGDFHCGLRGFSREAMLALGLKSQGMEFASEMVVKSALQGLRIEETPTTLKPDGRTRAPHLKTWRDGWRHLRFLLLHSPKFLFIYPGAAMTLLGLLGVAALGVADARVTSGLVLGVHTLVASCFAILIGVQLVMFGALARRYAMVEGFLPKPKNLGGFLLGLTLETILQGALVVFLLGAAGAGWAVEQWAHVGFGPLEAFGVMRLLVVSLTAVAVSVQLAASGFLASVFTIRR